MQTSQKHFIKETIILVNVIQFKAPNSNRGVKNKIMQSPDSCFYA